MGRLAPGLAALLALAASPAARAVDLEGYWYVLVHYQDKDSNKPDAWRWDDRVWRFHRNGDTLEWSEWPIVSFQDESGRFERLSGNRAARVVSAWEPNPAQLADIKDGLAVNSRGEKTKTLRAAAGGTGWSSGEGPAATSATVITYSETWSIAGLPDTPAFTRADSMGSASTESMEGRTEYHTETVKDAGEELLGSFDRDGSRVGNFRMIRSAEVGHAGEQDLDARQRKGIQQRAVESGVVSQDEVAAMMAGQIQLPPDAKGDDRAKARAAIRKAVEDAVRQHGNDPAAAASLVDGMTRRIERALFDEGKSVDEVQHMVATGQLGP